MRYLTACTLGLAFGAGLLGTEALGVVVLAIATFALAFAHGHAPWRWATLSLAVWAMGIGLGFLPTLLKEGGAGVTVAMVYASAFAAAGVNWGARRLVRQR
ncbi:MAG TPA: hypothetical protein VKD28_08040 [Gemmatimonadales bacterium]|nr:hypothetical protein [Gemmatimonadales bacterium]